jgi:single-strand DNA-binding protein
MPSINKSIFIGNLGRDPEMRYTPNGQPVTEFSLAVNENYQKDGEWQQETTWVNCVAWGQTGERIAENLRKGHLVYVEARYKDDSWKDDESGKTMHRARFIVSVYRNLTSKEDRENPGGGDRNPNLDFAEREAAKRTSAPAAARQQAPTLTDIDDLPFLALGRRHDGGREGSDTAPVPDPLRGPGRLWGPCRDACPDGQAGRR